MSWSFLTRLLEEIHNHSTFMGKIWLTVFIIFRIVMTAVVGESMFYDENCKFTCNTEQPGCVNVCFNTFLVISHVRFWNSQIVVVAMPAVLYVAYAVHRIAILENDDKRRLVTKSKQKPLHQGQRQCVEEAENGEEEEDPMVCEDLVYETHGGTPSEGCSRPQEKVRHDGRQQIRSEGLMCAYVVQLVVRFLLEGAFLYGQYRLYGFTVPSTYVCSAKPCPHKVDCFTSRSTEKTIFLRYTYAVTGLCVSLSVLEVLYLAFSAAYDKVKSSHRGHQKVKASKPPPLTCPDLPLRVVEEAGDGVSRCSYTDITAVLLDPPSYSTTINQESKQFASDIGTAKQPRVQELKNLLNRGEKLNMELQRAHQMLDATVHVHNQQENCSNSSEMNQIKEGLQI